MMVRNPPVSRAERQIEKTAKRSIYKVLYSSNRNTRKSKERMFKKLWETIEQNFPEVKDNIIFLI